MLTDVRLPAQVGQVLVIVRDGCRQASTGTASLPQKRLEFRLQHLGNLVLLLLPADSLNESRSYPYDPAQTRGGR
ncbi:hypothetical protein OPV22_030943 [Ensete ventricosum]|uniref:Uncharacterized protein n=1 Tax=Ensete ventricosum TaxID=4639 RepID=A0AAV8PRH6_ENSVE|nr:hypothetical protein OPV22_030943 [Ensete ventricosum]